ncbi:GGDEF domain-containing protein [Roseateles violae]|uniref:diguanylate cyclase n=1 Tax=Roseateles violae TaxID=3058042 RepID=A0ABT8DYM5_9BURK|nr:GGDEF domain-containing protein [Pelomonas sp. PFR6]MDN3922674.1 GGDEF domain-containing protein [Pelomonas sp. PFR6]
MKIDVPTLMLALLIGFLLLSLQLGVAQRGALRQPELRIWAQGSWAMLGGFAMLALRPWIPLGASVLLGNGLMYVGITLYGQALHRYLLDQALPRWRWGAMLLAMGLLALVRDWPTGQRVGTASLLLVLLLLPSTWLVLTRGWRSEGSMRTVGLTLGVACLALCLRGAHAIVQPEQYAELMQDRPGPGLSFLVGFLSLLGAGFGFVLACFERVAKRMEEMATLDGLTGCVNRSTTDALLLHSLERGRREGSPVAFALLDLDHFKQINDRHGHAAGDAALRAFAAEVRARLRSSDVIGRMGGEEFGLLLPATDAPGAARLVEQIRAAVEALELSCPQGQRFRLTVSAGVVVAASDSGISADRLYMLADKALYRAKEQGRNRVLLGDEPAQPPAARLVALPPGA